MDNSRTNLDKRTWAFLKSWVPTCIQLSLKLISPNLAKIMLFSSHNSPALKPNAFVGQFLDLLNFPASIGSNCCSFRTKFSCLALKTSWKDKKISENAYFLKQMIQSYIYLPKCSVVIWLEFQLEGDHYSEVRKSGKSALSWNYTLKSTQHLLT